MPVYLKKFKRDKYICSILIKQPSVALHLAYYILKAILCPRTCHSGEAISQIVNHTQYKNGHVIQISLLEFQSSRAMVSTGLNTVMRSSNMRPLGGTDIDMINFRDLKHRKAEAHFYTLERMCWRFKPTQRRDKYKQEKAKYT